MFAFTRLVMHTNAIKIHYSIPHSGECINHINSDSMGSSRLFEKTCPLPASGTTMVLLQKLCFLVVWGVSLLLIIVITLPYILDP